MMQPCCSGLRMLQLTDRIDKNKIKTRTLLDDSYCQVSGPAVGSTWTVAIGDWRSWNTEDITRAESMIEFQIGGGGLVESGGED